ncbi:hypothetical protein IKG20_00075 [Candidatus Saccharibacteria bacterium]|nr:hypothetical protein [Candidatus Saccharibacteria bacterium]
MSVIVPTILTNDKNQYMRQYDAYAKFAKRIQLDISDGVFSQAVTIDESNAWRQPDWPPLDLHMMVMNPSRHLPTILKIKPALCIFHAEANENLLPLFQALKQAGIKTGVAILKQTYPGKIAPYIEAVDHVLIFAGQLGAQGGQADMIQSEKVPIIKSIRSEVEIGWDGGANMQNVRALAHSGFDVINVGSAIATAQDPAKAYADLTAELDKNGVVI